ncbi:MAG: metallophosphoesterase [Planctomycetota bacterium]|nr:metallophosphoesterase [Planctomycetota bacterium]
MGKSRSRGKYRRAKIRHALFTLAPDRLLGGRLLRRHLQNSILVRDFQVPLPRWREELNGIRIGHLSDLHLGDLMPEHRVDEINQLLVDQRLDLVAFTGDAVDLDWDGVERFFEGLVKIPAPLGHFLVLGNHDHLDDPDAVVAAARAVGITVLMNEVVEVTIAGSDSIRIGGVDWNKRLSECSESVAGLFDAEANAPSPRPVCDLLLSHNPKGFIEAVRQRIPLTLSGHTHGGQVALKGRPDRNLAVAHRLSAGFYEEEGSALFVTTGVGSWFPLRVHCPPEVVVLEMRHGAWVDPGHSG